jgi:hypothetical protein
LKSDLYAFCFIGLHWNIMTISDNFYVRDKHPFWNFKSDFYLFKFFIYIKTAARDLVLHGIVSQSNRLIIINKKKFCKFAIFRIRCFWFLLTAAKRKQRWQTIPTVFGPVQFREFTELLFIDYNQPIWLADNAM